MGYTLEDIEKIAKKLQGMPEATNRELSKQEAVKKLADEIASLQVKGYTLAQIAETLKGEGLSIATPTLKSYLQRAKLEKNTRSEGSKKPAKAKRAQAMTANKASVSTTEDNKKTAPDRSNASFTPRADTEEI